jgi:hypothetical protein
LSINTLYIAGLRVFGLVRTTTPVFGPSVLLLPPRLSLSLIVLPRPSVATSPESGDDLVCPAIVGVPTPASAEARTISEGGAGLKEH